MYIYMDVYIIDIEYTVDTLREYNSNQFKGSQPKPDSFATSQHPGRNFHLNPTFHSNSPKNLNPHLISMSHQIISGLDSNLKKNEDFRGKPPRTPLLPRVHLLKIQLAGDEKSFYRENPQKHGDCLEIWTHMFHLPCKIWYVVFLVGRSQFDSYQETKSAILEGYKEKHHTSSVQKWKTHNFHQKKTPNPKILPPVQHFTIAPTSTPPGNRSTIYPNPVPQSWLARDLSAEKHWWKIPCDQWDNFKVFGNSCVEIFTTGSIT